MRAVEGILRTASVFVLWVLIFFLFTIGSLLDQYPLFVFFILLYIWVTGESRLFGIAWDSKEKPLAKGFAERSSINSCSPDTQSKLDKDTLPFWDCCHHKQFRD